ncbi:MAG: hypothetical protein EBV07_01745 [Proteobacteria bacterium]|nr:hypothetical protein [Pseudomonadota bacterium]
MSIFDKVLDLFVKIYLKFYFVNLKLKKYLNITLNSIWEKRTVIFLSLFILVVGLSIDYQTKNQKPTRVEVTRYNVYTAEPLVLGSSSVSLHGMDSRAKKIEGVFRAYNCPMAGTGQYIVEQADKNGIPYWIVASIAFQESLCGKITPEKNGVESYNAWGWAVYGSSSKYFNNYEHGIKVLSEYLSKRFFKQGITDTCDIMKVYTPPSNGSWCRGVNYFAEKIQNFGTK